MKFQSKTEAFSVLIALLMQFKKNHQPPKERQHIEQCIERVKTAMENHEQDMEPVLNTLASLQSILATQEQNLSDALAKDIRASDFTQTPQTQFENLLGRRFESEVATTLLLQPTQSMMNAVGRVSQEILTLMNDTEARVLLTLNCLMGNYRIFTENDDHPITLGAHKTSNRSAIVSLLTTNDPAHLAEIMLIHFKFAQELTRVVPINHTPVRQPVGKLNAILTERYPNDTPLSYFSQKIKDDDTAARELIANEVFYDSPLFRAPGNRGRTGDFDMTRTNQLGLMLKHQDHTNIPTHFSSWVADCKSQPANHESQYVKDSINNDTVYVAGPSGMTGLFLGQMEFLANFENEDLKKHYLCAIVAYIAGGGFHSIHEIIGPAQFILDLVPGYKIQIPTAGQLAPPPNYHHFFAQQAAIDPEFSARINQAWDKYNNYFSQHYAPKYSLETVQTSITANKPQNTDINIKLDQALDLLNNRVVELEIKSVHQKQYKTVSKTTRNLYEELKALKQDYIQRSINQDIKDSFIRDCTSKISQTMPLLRQHRGIKETLYYFLYLLSYLSPVNIYRSIFKGEKREFQIPKTRSAETFEGFVKTLESIKEEPEKHDKSGLSH